MNINLKNERGNVFAYWNPAEVPPGTAQIQFRSLNPNVDVGYDEIVVALNPMLPPIALTPNAAIVIPGKLLLVCAGCRSNIYEELEGSNVAAIAPAGPETDPAPTAKAKSK